VITYVTTHSGTRKHPDRAGHQPTKTTSIPARGLSPLAGLHDWTAVPVHTLPPSLYRCSCPPTTTHHNDISETAESSGQCQVRCKPILSGGSDHARRVVSHSPHSYRSTNSGQRRTRSGGECFPRGGPACNNHVTDERLLASIPGASSTGAAACSTATPEEESIHICIHFYYSI
jgi:hypothetical protein